MKCPDCINGLRQPLLFGAPYPCSACRGTGKSSDELNPSDVETVVDEILADPAIAYLINMHKYVSGFDTTFVMVTATLREHPQIPRWRETLKKHRIYLEVLHAASKERAASSTNCHHHNQNLHPT